MWVASPLYPAPRFNSPPERWWRGCPASRWVTPEEFLHWKALGLQIGFGVVESGALVRSSYHADEQSQKYTGDEHLNRDNALAG